MILVREPCPKRHGYSAQTPRTRRFAGLGIDVQQTDAEFAFAQSLEDHGVETMQFMKQWKLSLHQFNLLAQYIYGVNDEEPVLPPALKVLIFALQAPRAT